MIVVVTKGVKKNFNVVLVAIAAPEVRMVVCLSVRNKFMCSSRLIFVMFLFL